MYIIFRNLGSIRRMIWGYLRIKRLGKFRGLEIIKFGDN